nr:reverse transcriptase domain-containing protein [Tanacetum cinerariifolium]
MRTRSSSNLPVVSPPNPSTSNPERQLLCALTEGYAKAIVVPSILAEQFKLKHSLINMMTSDQFIILEKDNPHDHISKLTHTVNQQTNVVTTAMIAILKQYQATPPLAFVKAIEEICVTCGGAHPYYHSGSLPSNTIANPKGELKAITTRSGIVLDGPFIPIPPPFINPEKDERVEETLMDQDLVEYTIKVLPPFVQKSKPPSQRKFFVDQ